MVESNENNKGAQQAIQNLGVIVFSHIKKHAQNMSREIFYVSRLMSRSRRLWCLFSPPPVTIRLPLNASALILSGSSAIKGPHLTRGSQRIICPRGLPTSAHPGGGRGGNVLRGGGFEEGVGV